MSQSRMDTRPDESDVTQPTLGPVGMMRWAWRQLTSMRTALFLLLLLAIGAVPGSIWPQRNIDAGRVADYLASHRSTGPWLDRLGFFDVYSSSWFAAIYLLLFVSLVGCVVPRSKIHWRAMRAQPPRAPRRLERLPEHGEIEVDGAPEDVLRVALGVLRAKRVLGRHSGPRRWRIRSTDQPEPDGDSDGRSSDGPWLSAECGYLRETGNLVFHAALIVVIVAVAVGHLFGWRGDRILVTGKSFSNTISAYDTFDPGPWVDTEGLSPFTVAVDKLDVTFEEQAGGAQRGAPRDFTAYTRTQTSPKAPQVNQILKVNGPLKFGGASVFLLGNGYAPVITVRDAKGQVLLREATPFLPQDANYKSVGAVKVSAASPKQLGFFGFFLPSEYLDKDAGPSSFFPDLKNPALALGVYEGELYPQGRPQSVYTLSTEKMTQLKNAKGEPLRLLLKPSQTAQLPDGRGSITFDSVQRWAGLSIRYDPGKVLALGGAVAALLGLIASLMIRRRRLFVRVRPVGRRTVVSIGGLAKGEDPGLGATIEDLLSAIAERTGTKV
ncbi:MAG TPA: cytochrome c biogenesis protein ResB [Dermatophilaceae bacterium]|nr:cytochrome c biogenesis protein ResB [Dermatophilaceae bacterium]